MGNVRRAQSPARRLAAQNVRELREAVGLTQERCALKYGVGLRTLRDIEAGRCRMTALELVKELQLAAAGSSREEPSHAPAIATVVDGAASRLAKQIVSQQTCSFGNESAGSRAAGNSGAADLLRAAAATQAPGSRSAGAHCTALPGPLVAETAKAAPLGGDEASPQGLLGRAANLTGAPASHVAGSPAVETAAAAAGLAPSGSKKAA